MVWKFEGVYFLTYFKGELLYMTDDKQKVHRLFWECPESGRRIPAGVAFYNDRQGDYRLCIDAFCDTKVYYLRPVSMSEGVINFRVESMVNKPDGIRQRREIGVGHASASEHYPVFMEIGPYDKTLVLEAAA
jgi:hypothetical protein